MYFIAGIIGGFILGVFRPLTGYMIGRFLIGASIGFIAYWLMSIIVHEEITLKVIFSKTNLLISGVLGITVGGITGIRN